LEIAVVRISHFLCAFTMAIPTPAAEPVEIVVESDSFASQGQIPARYTCDGADISPHLSWSGVPANAKSLVLSVDDPDAPRGPWNHWYVYDIPSSIDRLIEGASNTHRLPAGAIEAMNDFMKYAYGGPCPPTGRHRYVFSVRAIDKALADRGLSRVEVERRIAGHIIAEGKLTGVYGPRIVH
jgi:Raf kinase inhibitor-like YbhB/YbcL family protein